MAAARSLEGDILYTQGKLADAERMYQEALKLDPRADAVAIKLHRVLLGAGKANEADAWAIKWIAANPKDVSMRMYLGESALASRNLKASAGHYRAVLVIAPENVMALNNLAWISGALGDPKALGYAERATKLAPLDPSVLDTYGMLLVKQGDPGKALPYLERALQVAPARNDLRVNYAKALMDEEGLCIPPECSLAPQTLYYQRLSSNVNISKVSGEISFSAELGPTSGCQLNNFDIDTTIEEELPVTRFREFIIPNSPNPVIQYIGDTPHKATVTSQGSIKDCDKRKKPQLIACVRSAFNQAATPYNGWLKTSEQITESKFGYKIMATFIKVVCN